MSKKSKGFAYASIIASGLLWGCMGLFVRSLNQWGVGSLEIVGIRAMITAVLLGIGMGIAKRQDLRIRIKDLWCFLGTGICSIVFFNYCYFTSMTLTSLSVAAVLLYTAPVFVMLLSYILFREKITYSKAIACILTLVGCSLVTGIVGSDVRLSVDGVLLGLGAGFGYALYSIFTRYALERGYNSLTISFYTFLIAGVTTLGYTGIQFTREAVQGAPWRIGFLLLFAIITTVLPYILYTIGLKQVENGTASILASVEPVMATVWGLVIFKEKLTWWGILGMLLVFVAIVLSSGTGKPTEKICSHE